MSLPAGVAGVTLTTDGPYMGPDGTPAKGTLLVRARVPEVVIADLGVVMLGTTEVPIVNGTFSVVLMATDTAGVNPSGWTYQVTVMIDGAPVEAFDILLPAGAPHVSLPAITPVTPQTGTYVVVTGPPGDATDALLSGNNLSDVADVPSARLHLGLGTAATTASTAYDPAGAASTAAGNALTAAETYADAGDATTLAAAKAYTDAHAGSGGSTITTREAWIREEIILLTNAASWTLVRTSGGTLLGCSIPAAVGDRVRWDANFLRAGGVVFLDWVVLAPNGSILEFVTTRSATPATEGAPTMYPQQSGLPVVTGTMQLTVQAGQLDAGGHFTVALAYQGPADGINQKIYAASQYPFTMTMANIGPEPA